MPLYQFCPYCRGPLQAQYVDGTLQSYQCAACGQTIYQNAAPTVSAVIANPQGRILLTRRGIEPAKGHWDLPGGYLRNQELPLAGLARELQEELHIAVEIGPLIGIYTDYYQEPHQGTFNLFYAARYKGPEPRPDDDVSACQWHDPHQLPEPLAFHCIRQVLMDYQKLL